MKLASDFSVDQSIETHDGKKHGIVISNKLSDGDQVLAVQWSDGTIGKMNANDINVSLSVEEKFRLVQSEVNEKLRESARLLKEAANLASSTGKDLTEYDYDTDDRYFDVDEIYSAINHAGWSSSSLRC